MIGSPEGRGHAGEHGVQFADAVPVLEDERAITLRDHAHAEERLVTIGMDALARILTVVHVGRGNTIRVVSARQATPNERRQHLETHEARIRFQQGQTSSRLTCPHAGQDPSDNSAG